MLTSFLQMEGETSGRVSRYTRLVFPVLRSPHRPSVYEQLHLYVLHQLVAIRVAHL